MRIMIFSMVPWTFLWSRSQQIVSGLARRGFDIVYFQSPIYLSPSEFIRTYREGNFFLRRKIAEKISVVNLFLPNLTWRFRFVSEKIGFLTFKIYLRCLGSKPDIAIFYSLWYIFLLDTLKSMKVKILYDCVDEISVFYTPLEALKEKDLIKKSHLVLVVSRKLFEKVSKINSNCVYVPNAVDFDHFYSATKNKEKPQDVKNLQHPIVGFYGYIYDWIDIDLICKLADLHPDYSILLVGPVRFGLSKLEKYLNITMLGTRKYEVLPRYLSSMDVCLIPFKISKLTLSSNPIKLYEYLAAGKPVVSTALPEVYENASQFVLIAQNHADFIEKVEKAIKEAKCEDKDTILRRIDFARNNSWEKRVDTIVKLLRNM